MREKLRRRRTPGSGGARLRWGHARRPNVHRDGRAVHESCGHASRGPARAALPRGQCVCRADPGARARCPCRQQSLALRCGRARAGPGSQPGTDVSGRTCAPPGRLPAERALGGGRGGSAGPGSPRKLRGPTRPSRGAALASSHPGTAELSRHPHDSDRVAGSSFSVAVGEEQLFRAIVKMPNSVMFLGWNVSMGCSVKINKPLTRSYLLAVAGGARGE